MNAHTGICRSQSRRSDGFFFSFCLIVLRAGLTELKAQGSLGQGAPRIRLSLPNPNAGVAATRSHTWLFMVVLGS